MNDAGLIERCRGIELLILDVDGVLTDGRITYTDDAREIKSFHVRDGSALRYWRAAGKQTAIVSGRNSPTVARRAAELTIGRVVQGADDKLDALRGILSEARLEPAQVCGVGDDLPDLPLLKNCGLAVAVGDACPEVLAAAHFVTAKNGGQGAVREIVEILLRAQGHWHKLVERLGRQRL
jgi:3-deoxy-D-manno-octulosonate 8-phosphate phosphatase (KDO 8-P phosphatase)